ncbi:MAG: FAD-dependent oxidoreductase, partial [Lachnospiraceae bacterium]
MYKHLFEPLKIKDLELKNRIILPAMGTKFANKDRTVSQQLINYHVARAKGGTALNMVEVCSVHPESSPRKFLAIGEDRYIPGLKSLTDAIHEAGGKAGLQLWQGSLAVSMDPAAVMLVASDMPISEDITLPAITLEQIAEIVSCFGAAAKRAVKAGFDCVEVHVAHNYLPHSFLSPGLNHRTDAYGGSFENRARFPLEVIHAVRKNVPEGMPVFMRIDAKDDYLEDGLTIEDVIAFCKLAKKEGIDVLDISRGNIISAGLQYEVPPIDLERGFNIENAAQIRNATNMLTIGVGRINTPELAEKVLAEDKVDLVVVGRGQLADPDFCKKAKEGRADQITRCIGCNQGCYDGFENALSPHITCLRNPAVGREAQCELKVTKHPETVLIAGGGIGGLEAAITLKKRGHNPILCEASNQLGGQFLLAGEAPRKIEMKEAVEHMAFTAKELGVDIRLNTPVTSAMIAEISPHTFINAIGAVPIIPHIPGTDFPFVCDSHDVLSGAVCPKGKHIVVVGGGMVGMETAEYLSNKGYQVTDLEMLPEFCQDLGSTRKICVTESVYAAGITPVTNVTVTEIKPGVVLGKQDGEMKEYLCDSVVIAIGAKSRDGKELEDSCR